MTRRALGIRWAAGFMFLSLACCGVFAAPPSWAEVRTPTEYQVKAAYLYNFAKYAEWPAGTFADPAAPVIFGILGDDPFGKDLDVLTNRTINGRKIRVRRFQSQHSDELQTCNVLFIGASEQRRVGDVIHRLSRSGTLLVGDMERFARRGGMIGFIVTDKTVGFEINVDAVARAGITLHSRMLNMAVLVRETPRRKGD